MAALPPESRAPIIERAAAGENVSALRTIQEPKPGNSELGRTWAAFRTARLKATAYSRKAYLAEGEEEIAAIFGRQPRGARIVIERIPAGETNQCCPLSGP